MKITLRESVLLAVIVALGIGWWLDSRSTREAAQNQRLANSRLLMRLELAEARLQLLRPLGSEHQSLPAGLP